MPNSQAASTNLLSHSSASYEQLTFQPSIRLLTSPQCHQLESSQIAKITSKSKKLGQILKLASVRGAKVTLFFFILASLSHISKVLSILAFCSCYEIFEKYDKNR